MTLPNFLCIGVQRAATTWLHRCLQSHPDVYLPDEKELHFFNHNFDRGLDWYASHFDRSASARAIGEITPNYLHTAPLERIANTLPEARLIVILREPVSRAYSAYRLLNEEFEGLTFPQACASPMGNYLVKQSLYGEKLKELYEHFAREQVLVLLYDDVNQNPAGVYRTVCRHLGVDVISPPQEVNQTFNHILFPKTQQFLGRMKLDWAVEIVKKTSLGDAIKRLSKQKQGQQVKSQEGTQLTGQLRQLFDEDMALVEALIGRDLSHWMSAESLASATH